MTGTLTVERLMPPTKRARGREAQAILDVLPLAAASLMRRRDAPPETRYVDNPVGFIQTRLGEFLWSKQQEIARAIVNNRRVAVPSAHATGKSFLAARLATFWLESWPFGSAFVLSTAPTGSLVKTVLWREIGRAYWAGKLSGRVNQTEWYMQASGVRYSAPAPGEELVALGRKSSDYDPTALQGIHARRVLVIIDEAAGVAPTIFDAAESLAANDDSRILCIGNPTDPQSKFAELCTRPGSQWVVIRVDAYDSPNWTNEEVPDDLRPMLMGKRYAQQVAEDTLMVEPGEVIIPAEVEIPGENGEESTWWGRNADGDVVQAQKESPTYRARVRGQFAADDPESIVPLSWVRRCQVERDEPWAPEQLLPVELGLDVGGGGDETNLRERRGVKVGREWSASTPNSTQAVELAMQAIHESGATVIKVDSVGIGWAVGGRLDELYREGKHMARVVMVNVGTKSTDPMRFPKLRDELWWTIGRELSVTRAWDLYGLDEATVAQLCAPRKVPDSAGRTKVEPKEETIKRLHRSPDKADSLILAYYVEPGRVFSPAVGGTRPPLSAPQPGQPAVGGSFNPAQVLGAPIRERHNGHRNGY